MQHRRSAGLSRYQLSFSLLCASLLTATAAVLGAWLLGAADADANAARRSRASLIPTVDHSPVAGVFFSKGRRPITTGWESTPNRLRSSECQACHTQVGDDWQHSGHAHAWTDAHFARAYAREPRAWCRNCHAPLAAQEAGHVSRDEGIGCAACHVREGAIFGTRALGETPGGHPVQRDSRLGSAGFCAECHQFPFPRRVLEHQPEAVIYATAPMQNTFDEWSAARAKPCSECHAGGHRFDGPKNDQWLAAVFGSATLEIPEPGLVSLCLPLGERGHAMPTGDLFRSFVLEVSTDPEFRRVLTRRRYGREFDGHLEGSSFIAGGQSADTRVAASERALHLTFDRPDAGVVFARVRYFRNDPWIHRGWTPDETSARVVWKQRLTLPSPRKEALLQPAPFAMDPKP